MAKRVPAPALAVEHHAGVLHAAVRIQQFRTDHSHLGALRMFEQGV